jgi:hypothetical protein
VPTQTHTPTLPQLSRISGRLRLLYEGPVPISALGE